MSDASPGPSGSAARMFNPDGSVRRFPGNAILCRIGSGNHGFGTINSIQSALRHEGFARKFAFAPAPSFHMTVFDGAKDELREAGIWPADMEGKPLADVTTHFAEKLAQIDPPPSFRMKPTAVALDPESGSVIRLAPGDHGEARRLRVFRERLADLLNMPLNPAYATQITLSYLAGVLDGGEQKAIVKAHAALTVHLSRALSMLELGLPEFCRHENMLYFERVLYLGGGVR